MWGAKHKASHIFYSVKYSWIFGEKNTVKHSFRQRKTML